MFWLKELTAIRHPRAIKTLPGLVVACLGIIATGAIAQPALTSPYGDAPGPYGGAPGPYGGRPGPYGDAPGSYSGGPGQYGDAAGPHGGAPGPYGDSAGLYGGVPAPHGGAAAAHDGVYVGQAAPVGGSGPGCRWNPRQLAVRNGQISRPILGARIAAVIAPDGSFSGSGSRQTPRGNTVTISLTGRISQGSLEGTVHSPRCTYRLTYRLSAGQPGRSPGMYRPYNGPATEQPIMPPEEEGPQQ